ncbi:MAG: hypothetical protein GC190_12935 [Alphaproteobacteria bacterium]|nr:hypothetical protein [Alphaproteobacteria bacterium]
MHHLRLFALLGLGGIAAIALVLVGARQEWSAPNILRPAPGIIDLSNWRPTRDGPVRLTGAWKFFDGLWQSEIGGQPGRARAAHVPGPWPLKDPNSLIPRKNGFGTYHLSIILPAGLDEPLAINSGQILSAYRIFLDGTLLSHGGRPASLARDEQARTYSRVVTLPTNGRVLTLDIELSNHVNAFGGIYVAPTIGTADAIAGRHDALVVFSLILVGAMLFAALYHGAAFAFSGRAFGLLAFALFAALMSTRTMLIDPLADFAVPLIGQDWVWRVDYAATMMILPAAYWFFCQSFPTYVHNRLTLWVTGLCASTALITLTAGAAAGHYALKAFELLAVVAIGYLSVGLSRAALANEIGARVAFVGWVASAAAVIHDILLDQYAISGPGLVPFGFLAFLLCLSGSILTRVNSSFRSSEHKSEVLGAANEKLEQRVKERTAELQNTISELKVREQELEQAREGALAASAAKSRFLATMSHELRTPLNAILGFAELIQKELYGPAGDPRYVEYARIISESGAHLLSLIRDILDLSKVEAGKFELHEEILCAGDIVEEALRLAGSKSEFAHDVATIVPRSLPKVRADRRAAVQILVNLLSNAAKFTPAGGKVFVEAEQGADGGLSIRVRDTGIGMAPEDIPKALDAFSQVDQGTARRHEGTGLGLPIARSLMELHGGRLSIESVKDQGTTVVLYFPPNRTVLPNAA